MKKANILYNNIYNGRFMLARKAYTSLVIQLIIMAIGLFLLKVYVGYILLLMGIIRLIFWIKFPKEIIQATPNSVILFPYSKRRKVSIPCKDIIKIRLNDWWDPINIYGSYSVAIFTKYGGYYKLHYVKETSNVVKQLRRLKYERSV